MFFINNFFCRLRYRENEEYMCQNGCKKCCPETCEIVPEHVQQRYQIEIFSEGKEVENDKE